MRTILIKTLPLLAAGLLLTGCGSSDLKPSSLDDVVKTWEDFTGNVCTRESREPLIAAATTECSRTAVLSIYDSEGKLNDQIYTAEGINDALGTEARWGVGENWSINDSNLDHNKFVEEQGGRVVDIN